MALNLKIAENARNITPYGRKGIRPETVVHRRQWRERRTTARVHSTLDGYKVNVDNLNLRQTVSAEELILIETFLPELLKSLEDVREMKV